MDPQNQQYINYEITFKKPIFTIDDITNNHGFEEEYQELESLMKKEEETEKKYYSLSDDDMIVLNYDIDSFKKDIDNINSFDNKEYKLLKYDYSKNIFFGENKEIKYYCLYYDNIRHLDIDQTNSNKTQAVLEVKSKPYEIKRYLKENKKIESSFEYKYTGLKYSCYQWLCSNPFIDKNYDFGFGNTFLLIRIIKRKS